MPDKTLHAIFISLDSNRIRFLNHTKQVKQNNNRQRKYKKIDKKSFPKWLTGKNIKYLF